MIFDIISVITDVLKREFEIAEIAESEGPFESYLRSLKKEDKVLSSV